MRFDFGPTGDEIQKTIDASTGFILRGLAMESADFDTRDRTIKLTSQLSAALPTINLRWVRKDAGKGGNPEGAEPDFVELPLYLNRSRKNLVTSVKLPTYGLRQFTWYQRGVALFAS